jgi:hypothetical protein
MKSDTSKEKDRATPGGPPIDEWEKIWKEHWSHTETSGYELPKRGAEGEEAVFLTEVRTREKEIARLDRIQSEFIRGFKGLGDLGPAVTVFGSARFREDHRYYNLARDVGAELARAGFATLTGGGPGIMEAGERLARTVFPVREHHTRPARSHTSEDACCCRMARRRHWPRSPNG